MILISDFTYNLRSARENAGYSQADLAKLIPCSQMTVAQWEMGNRTINHKDLIKVCRVLDISADELLGIKKGD